MDPHASNMDDGNTHSNNFSYPSTRFPLNLLSDTAPPDPNNAPPRSMPPGYMSKPNAPLQPSSPVGNLPSNLSNDHLFFSAMADYQPSFPCLSQQLQQQPHYSPQYLLPSHSLSLENPAYPSLVCTAASSNRALLAHVDPHANETVSMSQGYSMLSALHVEEIPQSWLWNACQPTTMDSMQLDHISTPTQEQQQQQAPQLDSGSHLALQPYLIHQPLHSMALSSGIHIQDPIWHPNPLELTSRAVVPTSTPVVCYESTSPASNAATIANISSFDPTTGPSESGLLVNHPGKSTSTATSGILRPSRSDGVGRKSRRSSSKTSGSLLPSGRSGRSRSLVSSPRSPFLSDPNETFGMDLSRTTLPYSLYALQPHNNFHHSITHSGHGNGYFSPSLSCSAASSSPSPSMSPQLLPHSSLNHPSSLTPAASLTKVESPIQAPVSTAPAFVRLPPPMFQCPMEKCPKSFARAYNLHVHLKTQHHLASKELAAVSPLRAPPSAPPIQIITPEEVAAGTTVSDKSTPLVSRSGSRATDSTMLSDQTHAPSTSTGKCDNIDKSGGDDSTNACCGGNIGEGNDDDLECDSSCISPALGGSMMTGQGRSFACHLCSRIFSRKHDLHRHIRVHTGSKPYLCTNCNKAFARTDALCRHYKVEDDCRQVLMEVEAVSGPAGDEEMVPPHS